MTTPMDDTLTAIGRQPSITYLPTALEPLPREFNDLVAQLVEHREILPFPESLLAGWGAGYAGDRSAQSNNCVLTPRERDVLAMISQGLSNKRSARALEISPETVKTHVKRIFLKLAVNTRTEAVCRAGSLGLLWFDSGDGHGFSRKQQAHPSQRKLLQEVSDGA
jgi:DNA-binding CsgD family transcriptional regulator